MGDWCKVRCGRPSPGVIHPIILTFITFQIVRHFWQGKLNLFLFKMAIAWLLVKSYSSPGEIHRRQEKYICKKNSLYWLTKCFLLNLNWKHHMITSKPLIFYVEFLSYKDFIPIIILRVPWLVLNISIVKISLNSINHIFNKSMNIYFSKVCVMKIFKYLVQMFLSQIQV